ncbi:MAG: hypothetical protein K9K21_04090, partial [Desulfotignum sp.]|nr:hypothetical protein [Desulfotignum sp.]
NEIRQQFKDQLLKLDKQRVQAIARRYFDLDSEKTGISVISGKSLLEKANQALEKDGHPPLALFKI